ncbi:MAG: type IX secretion system membrane protein PorP/SprF, partial [Maribacter dokdonensis]|uniref:type IX secretion system membrane protein PorP/SprF n=1 Tax=Maribacter dokdonensis TaxID=320912 RepID=UPI00329A142C
GLITLLTTNKYWAQAGYNSFYGFSGGIGGRFFKRLSFGALVEVGTSSDLKGQDPTFELVTSYKLGKQQTPAEELEEQLIAEEKNKEESLGQQEEVEVASTELTKAEKLALKRESKKQERLALIESKRLKDSIQNASRQSDLAVKQSKRDIKRKRDSLENAKAEQALAEAKALQQQRQKDSIAAVMKREAEAVALAQQRRQDSIAESKALAMRNEVVEVKAGEKYEEVTKEGALEPGYYLIANVFGTKKYLDAFLADMKKRGINAKSFFREKNKYNYVYLAKFDFIKDARQARDSKLNGKYTDKIWIFRVTGE